jgi:hypothetical protein
MDGRERERYDITIHFLQERNSFQFPPLTVNLTLRRHNEGKYIDEDAI